MNITQKYQLDQKVISCQACVCSQWEVNNNQQYYMGYGKLLSKLGSEGNEIMIVGMNPSYIRWQGLIFHFGGGYKTGTESKQTPNVGYKFLKIFEILNVLPHCYITNIVKCSTQNNQLNYDIINTCYQNIFRFELSLVQPKLILAAGKIVYDFLKTQDMPYSIEYIAHPNYYFSYNFDKIESYIQTIQAVLKRYNFAFWETQKNEKNNGR